MTRLFALACAMCLATPAWASAESIVAAVEAKYASVETLQGEFEQTVNSGLYGTQKTSGELSVKRPTMMDWKFSDGKRFVTDGKTMWIHTPADNQVIRYKDISQSAGGAELLLQSLDKVGELFDVTVLEESAVVKRISLKPKKEGGAVKELQLTLDSELVVKQVGVVDAFDQKTDLVFKSMKLGVPLTDKRFQFEVPAGSEVIDAN